MLSSSKVLAFCLVSAALAASCVAFNDKAFFADLLAEAKFGDGGATKAKTSTYGYYGAETQVACLSQTNFHDCRFTGCYNGDGGDPTDICGNFFLQTDFACCPKHHSYGYDGEGADIDIIGLTTQKAGTCDWEFSLYKWNTGGGGEELLPVVIEDGTAAKLGTVWGTCYLNAASEQCDSPLCERMAISVQGGLYVTQAYSYTNSTGEGATATDTCGDGFNGGRAQAPNSARASLVEGGIFVQYLAQYLMEAGVWAIQGGNNIAGRRPSRASKVVKASADSEVATASAGSKVAYDYESHGTLYSGYALIISGPFYETSKHDDKIAETGLFEWAPFFNATAVAGSEPTNNWPVIREQAAKLRFTRESSGYGGYEGDSSANRRR